MQIVYYCYLHCLIYFSYIYYLKVLRQSFQQYYFILIVLRAHLSSKTRSTVRVVAPE